MRKILFIVSWFVFTSVQAQVKTLREQATIINEVLKDRLVGRAHV